MNLADCLLSSAKSHPDKIAIYYGETRIPYRSLLEQSLAVAAWLKSTLGVRPGDRVGLWLRNRPEFVPALFGALHAGAIVVPINSFLKPDELSYLVEDAGLTVILTDDGMLGDLRLALANKDHVRLGSVDILPTLPPPAPGNASSSRRTADDLAMLIYTSGTTGRPKGAMLTHGNLLHNVESCRKILEVVEVDRFVLLLPMFHSFMLTVCILLPVATAGSIVLIKSLHPAKALLAELIGNGGSVLPAMAQVFRALAATPKEVSLPLRLCISGAGPLPASILATFNARFPDIPLIEGYGLSEASPVVSVNPIHGPWIAGTIGVPIPNVELAVMDDTGNALPDLVDGELCVRGGNVMQGYWNAPEKTSEALRDGWLLTGDVGHRRADGYFVITDRKKDMLKPNGMNVYPREIEEVIYQFPGIREAAVVGEPDERRGERPIAFVSMDESATYDERALIEFLRERLADYKLPRRAIQLPALPRNATGKILKIRLREILREG
ncbi:MAG: AMP-binding protein [Verrucomicrobiales bacterium]|nr:AMP-binding protein [Verrucomicrobiales bacterium]